MTDDKLVEMRMVAVGGGNPLIRAVYDEDDGRGEYVIINGEKIFLDG